MKKWLVIVEDEQYDWIKKMAAKAGVKGSKVVRKALKKAQEENADEIVASLRESKDEEELTKLERQKARLEEQIRAVKRGAKVLA